MAEPKVLERFVERFEEIKMKCEDCTRRERSGKTNTADQENAAVNVRGPAQENGEGSIPRLCGFLKSPGRTVLDVKIAATSAPWRVRGICVGTASAARKSPGHPCRPPPARPGGYAERALGHPVTPTSARPRLPSSSRALGKDYFARRQNLSPDKIFHVTVAPGCDKTLEALREGVPTVCLVPGVLTALPSGETAQIVEQSDLASKDGAGARCGDVTEAVRPTRARSDGPWRTSSGPWPRSCPTRTWGAHRPHPEEQTASGSPLNGTQRLCCAVRPLTAFGHPDAVLRLKRPVPRRFLEVRAGAGEA
ncbi:hypothetical protein QTO34_006284 [Cnephaeus nilssonii]|uniref:Uncharacterized protein n=1 Tax=Cnephaeus nilssonii TaxID=3371016 RepID=A0AA40HMC0_CNENI|nr:hypothetical protein QTO34_006284 [Eptesicus nilssonii]